jgi:MFS family permease
MLGSLFLFALGSALCGAATSMNFLIAARTIQGVGGGGIQSLAQIILSDMIPLRERGFFNGLIGV